MSRHFNHRLLITGSFAYNESSHDSYPQFPPSLLGTLGAGPRLRRTDGTTTTTTIKTLAFLESRSAKARSTNRQVSYSPTALGRARLRG